jgi:hypothetical protein
VKLLYEADPLHPEKPLERGEFRVEAPHVHVACSECGGKTTFHQRVFKDRFVCRFCGHEEQVKLVTR